MRLLADAILLRDQQRWPSAFALATLAIEEFGKESIIRTLVLETSPERLREVWKNYTSHPKKNVQWIVPELIEQGARKLEDFRQLFASESDHGLALETLKQLGVYTDCLEDVHWSEPETVVGRTLAERLVSTAEVLAQGHIGEVLPEEVELWVKHLKPVWRHSSAEMAQAAYHWHQETVARGLRSGDWDIRSFLGLDQTEDS